VTTVADPFLNRRALLRGLGALGCSAAAFPLMTEVSFASAPWDGRLVVILLRGAMDGLDVVRPTGDPEFAALRANDFGAGATDLDGFFSLNDGLSELLPLWRSGELAFAHAVSTPYRDGRSHFDGQHLLETGLNATGRVSGRQDGWLNRLLQATPGVQSETGFAIGQDAPLILFGDAPVANWSPRTRFMLGEAAQHLLTQVYQDDPLFRDAAAEAFDLARSIEDMDFEDRPPPNRPEHRIAQFAANRLRADTRIASFSLNGWDTHLNQERSMRRLLGRLADTILTLKQGLGETWSQTTVLAMTEFGRTARQNGSAGTDHGTGGAMLIAGGAVRGGHVYGRWPGLSEADLYDRRDLMPTNDVRAYAGSVMQSMFELDRDVIERVVFPGVSITEAPNVIL
jgi:uncharacterized protein (DUF1501 family)